MNFYNFYKQLSFKKSGWADWDVQFVMIPLPLPSSFLLLQVQTIGVEGVFALVAGTAAAGVTDTTWDKGDFLFNYQ